MITHGSLFTGIAGFDLAAEWAGFTNVFQVENDPFCIKVLEKNFPNVKRYKDIKDFDGTEYKGTIDIISGGFPCQPFSIAGKQRGTADDRHLWPEMLRVISEIKPEWIIAENVPNLIAIEKGMVFEQVLLDLETEGYEVQPFIIPACAVNAPHRRDRIWIIANSRCLGRIEGNKEQSKIRTMLKDKRKQDKSFGSDKISTDSLDTGDRTRRNKINGNDEKEIQTESNKPQHKSGRYNEDPPDSTKQGLERQKSEGKFSGRKQRRFAKCNWEQNWYEVATEFCRVDARISNRMDRLKSLGNAIVPHVAYEIFKAINTIGGE